MQPFPLAKEKKDRIMRIFLERVQQKLLHCYDIFMHIAAQEAEIIAKVNEKGIETQSYGRIASITQIENLKPLAENFLYSAKSTLRDIKSVILEFFDDDPRVENLKESNYRHVAMWLEQRLGRDDEFAKLVTEDFKLWIDEVYNKRNAVEHPGGYSGRLEILNFTAIQEPESKQWKGIIPLWRRNQEPSASITSDMQTLIDNMLRFSEDVLVHCLQKVGCSLPVVFYEIPLEERNPQCPIRLGVTLDQEKMKNRFPKLTNSLA
jgi:hypothetical protein